MGFLKRISRRERGENGESQACLYLTRKGYRILERNWKASRGEVDLIAEKNRVLYFVEVKWRGSKIYGTAAESIGLIKQKRIVGAVLDYLQRKKISNQEIRLAALTIDSDAASSPTKFLIDFFEFPLDLPLQYY